MDPTDFNIACEGSDHLEDSSLSGIYPTPLEAFLPHWLNYPRRVTRAKVEKKEGNGTRGCTKISSLRQSPPPGKTMTSPSSRADREAGNDIRGIRCAILAHGRHSAMGIPVVHL